MFVSMTTGGAARQVASECFLSGPVCMCEGLRAVSVCTCLPSEGVTEVVT